MGEREKEEKERRVPMTMVLCVEGITSVFISSPSHLINKGARPPTPHHITPHQGKL
jgi:hypothetical protein